MEAAHPQHVDTELCWSPRVNGGLSGVSVALREGDEDAKNRRLMAWECGELLSRPGADNQFHHFTGCSLHHNNHLVEDVVKVFPPPNATLRLS